MKILPCQKKMGLCEIGQDILYYYSFVTSEGTDYRMVMPWVKCKDYLQDAVRATLYGKDYSDIHGFSYDGDPPVYLNKTLLAVKSSRPEFKEENKRSVKILRLFEKDAGFKLMSKIQHAEGGETLFLSSKNWLASPFSISLYSFLIRIGARNVVTSSKEEFLQSMSQQQKGNDAAYFRHSKEYLFKILPNLWKIAFKNNTYHKYEIYKFHNMGITALPGYHKEITS